MTDVNLSEIQSLAAKVAAQHEELTAANAAEESAQVQLLDAVVSAARPALRALSSQIKIRWHSWWIGTTHTNDESEYAEVRGLVVDEEKADPSRGQPTRDENRGTFGSYNLFLAADGRWLRVDYEGQWSRWQGEGTEWTATVSELDTAAVVEQFDVDVLVGRIADALKQQAEGKATERAKAARERAERVAAVTRLL